VTLETWARFFDAAEPVYAAIAMTGDYPVGFVHSIYHRSTWAVEDYCYLQDLFVSPDARGGGVGRALIEHVYQDAKHRGASRLYWLTHETNYAARMLYDKVADRPGFIQYRMLIT
jgi:GNAT superfamily N-acetyltransferase